MAYPASANFTRHAENLCAVDKSLTQVERAHKRSIRENDEPTLALMRKMHLLLVGMRAEAALRKIICDPTGFNDREREIIWKYKSQRERWTAAIDHAARRHYSVPVHLDVYQEVPTLIAGRLTSLTDLLKDDLDPVITNRNKLAHGEWIWQLKSRQEDQFREDQLEFDFNYLEIDSRHRVLKGIASVVSTLVVSAPTFDRDFDGFMMQIDKEKQNLGGSGYNEFAASIRRTRRASTP